MLMPQTKDHISRESGFASIVIALTLVTVLGLLTLGFTQLSRREQQQALNKQLAVQAAYAAESGVNDVTQQIASGALTTSITTCSGTAAKSVNIPKGVSIPCTLVDLVPDNLFYNNVTPGTTKYTTFTPTANLSNLKIEWNSTNGRTSLPASYSATKLPPLAAWNTRGYPPVIQFSIVPVGNNPTRDNLQNNLFTVYLYPSSAGKGGSVSYSTNPNDQGKFAGGCNAGGSCDLEIRGISPSNTEPYLIYFTGYYDTAAVRITATGTSPGAVGFKNAQAVVDVTGKAQDVLKRIQVRVPFANALPVLPGVAIEAQNICKRMQTAPTDPSTNPNGTNYLDASGGTAAANGPCDLSSSQ